MVILLPKLLSSWRNAGLIDQKTRCVDFKKQITLLLNTEHNSSKYKEFIEIAAQPLNSQSECIEEVCGDSSASTINIVTLLILLKTTAENQEQEKEKLNEILLSTLKKVSKSEASKEIDILMKETVTGFTLALEGEGALLPN
ncbi:hypothetical protein [Candidiatus Paracoxiella cheracis]|uniref:hypothetical protein n=1 Tax=Candidiatus Paracoxiella cheracis TaxID=3405120 RepID=UPI003BF4BB8C